MEWLIPYTTREFFSKGDILFRQGEVAGSMYFVVKGKLRIDKTNVTLNEGEIVEEIGLFSPMKERTATLVCETDIDTLTASEDKLMHLYYQNPNIGFYLTRLLSEDFLKIRTGQAIDVGSSLIRNV